MFTVSLQSSRRYLTTESEPSGHLAAMGESGGDGSGQSSSHNCTSWAICIPVCSLIDRDKQPAVREVKSTKSNGGEAVFSHKLQRMKNVEDSTQLSDEHSKEYTNRAGKLILRAPYLTPSAEVHRRLGWMDVKSIHKHHKALLLHKALNNQLPPYMRRIFTYWFKQWIKALDGEVGDTIRTSQLSTPDFVPEPEQVLIASEAQQTNFETDG
ncbi:hypothetical protein Bbelb_424480 [Branchiostoma belcheri]|nr:hypothetical protein Bbelb_424480 [Branchiostoma belcheri]